MSSFLRAVKINSGYIQTVDKFYPSKGEITLWMLLVTVLPLAFASGVFFLALQTDASQENSTAMQWAAAVVVGLCLIVASVGVFSLKRESFSYTHFPIRLNRKTRTVYVFRPDGTVLRTPWDDLFICFGRDTAGTTPVWDIRCHVLDEDGETVRETFALSEVDPKKERLLEYFEFIRRYMDEGPQAVIEEVPFVMPVEDRRESFRHGWEMRWADANQVMKANVVLGVLLLPFIFAFTCARWFAVQTSKIPRWPPEVEAENPIDPDDPWVRDFSTNPAAYR